MQGSEQTPKAPLGNNARPLQPLHHRTVRTNIDFQNAKVIWQLLLSVQNLKNICIFFFTLRIKIKIIVRLCTKTCTTEVSLDNNCYSSVSNIYISYVSAANKWTVDAAMSSRGRERGLPDIDTMFNPLLKK